MIVVSQRTKIDFKHDASDVQKHLAILQGIINRMAGNSASCKNWCVVLVAAILVLVARTDTTDYALLALLPTALFLFLDAYYLAMEKDVRCLYSTFVSKIHKSEIMLSDLYSVGLSRSRLQKFAATMAAILSFSVGPFYLMLSVAIALVWKFDCVKALLGF